MSLSRVAAAPISWGVCEVPGWGYQMPTERVLKEMAELGLGATEFGPDVFLPAQADQRDAVLASFGLSLVGGFVPLVLHDPRTDPLAAAEVALQRLLGQRRQMMVVAAVAGNEGYDQAVRLDETGWAVLLENLVRLDQLAESCSVSMSLHPHVGTLIERPEEVGRLLADSSIPLCLDTGHLLIGGNDPLQLARQAPERIAHVHLKDVDDKAAQRVRAGSPYALEVAQGLYRPLGRGDVDIAGILAALEGAGYGGWYVMEQDAVLSAEPPAGLGPIQDVETSLSFLEATLT